MLHEHLLFHHKHVVASMDLFKMSDLDTMHIGHCIEPPSIRQHLTNLNVNYNVLLTLSLK